MRNNTVPLNLASLPGPETIARRTLSNGVVGLAYENWSSPSVVVHGWLWVGSIDAPPAQAGLAAFTAAALTHGTPRRTFAQIGEETESVGAAISIGSSGHTTRFTVKCLIEDLPLLMDILTDCLYHPTFPPAYLEKHRGEIMTALEQRENDTQSMAGLHFGEMLYPNHPYGYSHLGYKTTIPHLTRDDILGFYRQRYGARGMAAAIVGAIEREAGLDILEKAFGLWQGVPYVQAPLPPVEPLLTPRIRHTCVPGKTQSDIVLGWVGMARRDPDFLPAYLANCILGQFGMMGRIGCSVREEQGLAYYAYSALDAGIGAGPWMVSAGVAPENVDQAVEAVMEEIVRLCQEPVDAAELADNKAFIVDSLPLRLEGNEGIAAQMANMELYGLGLDYLQRFPAMIEAISALDVMAVVHKYIHPEAFVLSVAGPE